MESWAACPYGCRHTAEPCKFLCWLSLSLHQNRIKKNEKSSMGGSSRKVPIPDFSYFIGKWTYSFFPLHFFKWIASICGQCSVSYKIIIMNLRILLLFFLHFFGWIAITLLLSGKHNFVPLSLHCIEDKIEPTDFIY